jgi:uncharacterized protein (TIGR03118 family)
MRQWFRGLQQILSGSPSHPTRDTRLSLETLEERTVLSGNVLQTNLVSDLPGVAAVQDPNLVNPWGIAGGGTLWISDNNAGVSTLYNVPGPNSTPVKVNGLVVSIPTPGDPTGATGTPDGIVVNTDSKGGGFELNGITVKNGSETTSTAPAIFIFATEDGTIVGWNPGVNPVGADTTKLGTYGIIAKDNSGNNFTETNPDLQTGAVYKGLAIGSDSAAIFGAANNGNDSTTTTVLYAANFRSGHIEVYDPGFKQVQLNASAFIDPNLPKGYAPFDVAVLNGKVYVTYAKQNDAKHDDVAGPGNGFVDMYNLDGTGEQRLISRGALNSPWGLDIAPAGFGGITAPNSDPVLLVGNFGDGRINAFDANTGQFLTNLKDPDGEPIQIDGLWALGNGNGSESTSVLFTAGLFKETHGLFGTLSTAAPGSPEGNAELQLVTAAEDVVNIDKANLQADLGNPSITFAQIKADFKTLEADEKQLAQVARQFADDFLSDLGIPAHHHHHHHDGDHDGDHDD